MVGVSKPAPTSLVPACGLAGAASLLAAPVTNAWRHACLLFIQACSSHAWQVSCLASQTEILQMLVLQEAICDRETDVPPWIPSGPSIF